MNIKTTVCSILAVLFLISCDNQTSSLGGSLTPQGDVITVTSDSCFATSRTIKTSDSLIVMTAQCNLGRFTEQASGATIQTGYLTQLGCMENFSIADSVYGIGNHVFPQWFIDTVGTQKPYYANLKLYYSSFFGDSTNSIKIDVFPLERMIDASKRYYPDVDPSYFCNTSAKPLTSITVSGWNMQEYDSIRIDDDYYHCICISLPDSIAKMILEAYFNPDTRHYFNDSKSFMENLIKGFYIRCSQGDGTILYIERTVLEVNFKCIEFDDDNEPKMQSLMAEFLGNSEVLQMNSIKWTGLEGELADNSCTWIRSPFGVMTEITLPVDEMRDNEYVLNSAQLRLSSANTPSSQFKPSIPTTLLLIRKDLMQDFFGKNSVQDNVESYIATYSTKYGTYTYDNIAAMIEKMYNDRADWLEDNGKTLQNGGQAAYEQERPDWNKVVLIPVVANLDSRNSAISYSLDINMRQLKLIGGGTKIKIKTIRSKF
ncbi:MAG: DUF4270 domain-containing protein [Bacteroidaceae bacterium]|nr:DUF4270 domain-containing protein [Bacteroidaceae bacterium]